MSFAACDANSMHRCCDWSLRKTTAEQWKMLAWGYTSLAVARWIHPRLHAAAAPQLRRLLNITPPKPDAIQVLAYA